MSSDLAGRLMFKHGLPRSQRSVTFFDDLHKELAWSSSMEDGEDEGLDSLGLQFQILHHSADLDFVDDLSPEQMSLVADLLSSHPGKELSLLSQHLARIESRVLVRVVDEATKSGSCEVQRS